ncbi:MAG TPA: hypothetical protein VKX17_23330 [Planctomycetota bacterium]|nr:hypothetical protein [Planctomycetota bacterium]
MGLLNWLFGRGNSLPDETKKRFEAAIQGRGGQLLSWSGTIASVKISGDTHEYDLINLWQTATRQGRDVLDSDIAEHLDRLDAVSSRHRDLLDLMKVRALLRPRVTSHQLAATQPKLCQRPFVPNYLVRTLSVDWGDTASYVTDTTLESWNVPFEAAFKIGIEQLRAASSVDQFRTIDGIEAVLVNDCSDGIASSRSFILDDLFTKHDPEQGILFAVPNNSILLAHLVNGASSATAPLIADVPPSVEIRGGVLNSHTL